MSKKIKPIEIPIERILLRKIPEPEDFWRNKDNEKAKQKDR